MLGAATSGAMRRLAKELRQLEAQPPTGFSASPITLADMLNWHALIFGPEETIWENGTFKLHMTFPADYPFSPPKVRFITPMFHPNIYTNGNICLDLLDMKKQWSPTYDIPAILKAIRALLLEPNPNSPVNATAAALYNQNRKEYDKRVQQTVDLSFQSIEENEDQVKEDL